MGEVTKSTLWWPDGLVEQDSGFLVGWNTDAFNACIAGVVSNSSLHELETLVLPGVREHLLPIDTPPLSVLGTWEKSESSSGILESSKDSIGEKFDTSSLWLRCFFDAETSLPSLRYVN